MRINFARLTGDMAVRYGDREALVNVERGRRFTFSQLDRLTNQIVNMIHGRLGLDRGDRYFCVLDNDNIALLHVLTGLKGKAAVCLTNYRDSFEEHLWQIDLLEPKAVFLETALVERFHAPLRERGITITAMDPLAESLEGVHCLWDLLDGVPDTNPGFESDINADPLLYRFTGGTTGRGKCAEYTMDNWLACRDAFYTPADNPFHDGCRSLQIAPLSHGAAIGVLSVFFRGGCLVTQNAPDLAQWCRVIEEERITTSLLVPTLLYRLLELEAAGRHDLSTLNAVYYGAAPMSPVKLAQLQARFGNIFIQVYGSTECIQPISQLSREEHLGEGEALARRLASAGRAIAGAELILTDDDGNEVADGETGEIWMRTRSTIRGYFRNPEATASEFQDGFWKSGDLGIKDAEGYVTIVDRKKDMIITGGFNVYAIEVENALNAHPNVVMSAVVGIPHEEWGEAVHAEVVLRDAAVFAPEDMIDFAKERLGKHKAPKSIVAVAELPLSPAHKVLRRRVREKYWSGSARKVG